MLATEAVETPMVDSETPMVTLKALDGNAFKVPLTILKPAENLMEYLQGELVKAKQTKEPIEVKVQHCTSFTIEKVLEWLEDHAEDAPYDETTYQPDVTIFGEASEADVVQFMYAAEQFGIKPLIHTAAAKLAEFMNANPNPEKLKELFDPENMDEEELVDEDMEEDDSAAQSAIAAATKAVVKEEEEKKDE